MSGLRLGLILLLVIVQFPESLRESGTLIVAIQSGTHHLDAELELRADKLLLFVGSVDHTHFIAVIFEGLKPTFQAEPLFGFVILHDPLHGCLETHEHQLILSHHVQSFDVQKLSPLSSVTVSQLTCSLLAPLARRRPDLRPHPSASRSPTWDL